jgi:hypothetical protein
MRHVVLLILLLLLVSCDRQSSGDDVPLVGGYRLSRESVHNVTVYHDVDPDKSGIEAKVVEIGWTNEAIIVKRQALAPRNSFPGDMYQEPVPGRFDFWIIELPSGARLGPLTEEEYNTIMTKRAYIGLKLKRVAELRIRDGFTR